jgi:hypothetical protein
MNAFECVLNTPWILVSASECQWVIVNSPWTPIECTWRPMCEWEQLLNTHWVRMNTIEQVWTPNDSAWPPLSSYWVWLNDHEKDHICVRIDLHPNAIECLCVCLWVSIEHPLNAVECTWMPLSECWTPPEHSECMWMQLSEYWTALEHPLSAHEHLWVSISKFWMRTYRLVNLTNL